MPTCNLAIKDTVTGLWLTSYSTELTNSAWGNVGDALCFNGYTEQQFQDIFNSWGAPEGRFIGTNPRPR